ncbi:glutamyl-tRNA reductase [Texcoconibacillus texcoconensis]|uniref:Glutamyl-tRNA reductase n=1 Tax=Texcoconibacillus texcoconensis TaxID=1095777 RepID=A0A840QMT6_9BACI|nr:glutamyl-tRNA reductase [Texcoconibacillus texcoconensis]
MHILVVSLNYKTTPVEIREKFTFQQDINEALTTLKQSKSILECAIVSTCNRTEIYAVVDQLHTGRYYTKAFLSNWFDLPKQDFAPFLQIREGEHAVEHLLRVTCGLDSMVVGETQILGQIREAFFAAQNQETTGTIFNHLFKEAITLAKRAHSETTIGENAVSVSYAAVELGKKIFGSFEQKDVLIVGAGKMSELTAKHLHASGVEKITVMNRTFEKAAELAENFQGAAKQIDAIEEELVNTDILITSTGAKNYVIQKDMMEEVIKQRKGRPLFLVDIAVPRDIDPELEQFDNIYLYDIDDLQGIVSQNIEERKQEAEKIELQIEEAIVAFSEWVDTLGVVPVITALRSKALSIQSQTMDSLERKLPDLSEREKKVVRKHMKSVVNQMLKDPILTVKELPEEENAHESIELFTRIFNLEEDLKEQEHLQQVKLEIDKAEREWKIAKKKKTTMASNQAVVRS